MGNPKYLPNSLVWLIDRQLLKSILIFKGVISDKISLDLLKLIDWPECMHNLLRVSILELQLFWLASTRRIRSSAKKR